MTAKKMKFELIEPRHWNRQRLKELLHYRISRKVLVIGDVGVDRYTIGQVERISPEAPVPIVQVAEEKLKLGLAANVADNIRALGGEPWMVGVIGSDPGAGTLKALFEDSGISYRHLVCDRTRRTVLKERVVSERQQLLRIDYESTHALSSQTEAQVMKKVRALLPKAEAVILEDYAKGLIGSDFTRELFALARKHGKVVAVDPNAKSPLSLYRGAGVMTPNTKEAEALTGIRINDEQTLWEAGWKLVSECGARHVVITRGKEGMAIFSKGVSACKLIPTYAREVYDVSGAGDTVISMLSLALAGGATIEEACVLGNMAAGVEVGKRGTATVSVQEIEASLEFFNALRA